MPLLSHRQSVRRCQAAVFLVIITLFTAAALTQSSQRIEIRGTVINGVDGRPVDGVRVTLIRRVPTGQDILNEEATTDDRGTFVLWAPGTGEYSLAAYRAPKAFGEYGKDPYSGSQRWFSVSGRTTGIVVTLWEAPKVNGLVLDENDQPLAGVTVRTLKASVLGGRQVLKTVTAGVTGTNGAYSLQINPPGRYLLVAVPRFSASGPARSLQYHPGVPIPGAALPIDFKKGQLVDATAFRLERQRGFVISGTIELAPGAEGANSVDLFDAGSEDLRCDFPIATARVSNEGVFSFPMVVAGAYDIRFVRYATLSAKTIKDGAVRYNDQRFLPQRLASPPGEQTWWATERVNVLDKDVSISLRASAGVRISGRMVFKGLRERLDTAILPTRGVYLRSIDYRFFRPFQVGSARQDGTFATSAVPPGQYVLGMLDAVKDYQGYEGYQLESVTIEGREVAGLSFELTHDVSDAVLTFSSQATELVGVVSGAPGQQRFVLAWPEDEALWTGTGTQLGRVSKALTADGAFTMSLFPGNYRVVALTGVPPENWESSSFLRARIRDSERVVLPSGQKVVRNFTATSAR
jgi:hypothetical protein